MKTEVKTFLNLLSNYNNNKHHIELLNEKYDVVFYQLRNVKSIPFERVGTTNQLEVELRKHDLRDKLERIKNEIKLYKMINDYVDGILNAMPKDIKQAAIDKYVNNKTYNQIATKYNYSSAGLYRIVCKEIEKALNKALF